MSSSRKSSNSNTTTTGASNVSDHSPISPSMPTSAAAAASLAVHHHNHHQQHRHMTSDEDRYHRSKYSNSPTSTLSASQQTTPQLPPHSGSRYLPVVLPPMQQQQQQHYSQQSLPPPHYPPHSYHQHAYHPPSSRQAHQARTVGHPGFASPRIAAAHHHHRPYDQSLQSNTSTSTTATTATASRTFWNHYETELLVRLWLEFESQFAANKRNAGVWDQLAQKLSEQTGRTRKVRECRIKWKNMWAKHRDLVSATHMSLDSKLREFPHFNVFCAIRQRNPHNSSGQTPNTTVVGESCISFRPSPEQPLPHPVPPVPPVPPIPPVSVSVPAPASASISTSSLKLPPLVGGGSGSGSSHQPSSSGLRRILQDTKPFTMHDVPVLMERLDHSDISATDYDDVSSGPSMSGVIGRMRSLAATAQPAEIAAAVQDIMAYVERESQRRQMQSDRHNAIVAALADILAQTTTTGTGTSETKSRRSSTYAQQQPQPPPSTSPPS